MNRFNTLIAASLAIVAVPLTACSQEADTLSPGQTKQMEKVIRDYLVNNPEVIIEALDAYQTKMEADRQAGVQDTLQAMKAELTQSPNDPVLGNPDGDVTMVEFFDYRCGFCKRAFDTVQTLLKEDGNIRYVLKEFPILGPDSVFASQVAMAVWLHQKDKYQDLHVALMSARGGLNKEKVLGLAEEVGVDIKALQDQLDDPRIGETFEATRAQARALDITGTPGFVIGEHIAPGAVPLEALKEMVALTRKK